MMWSTSTRSVGKKWSPHHRHLPCCFLSSCATHRLVPVYEPARVLQYTQSPSNGLRVPWTLTCRRIGVSMCACSFVSLPLGRKAHPSPPRARQYFPITHLRPFLG